MTYVYISCSCMLYSPTQQDRDTGKEAQQEWYVAQKVGCFRGEPSI